MTGGLLLLAAALLLTCYNLWDERRAGLRAEEAASQVKEIACAAEQDHPESADEPVIPDYILDPEREMPETEIDGESYIGILELPALGLKLPVMGEWSYARLRTAPCRYRGSAYQGDLIIAAHNYRGHFRNLKELRQGDIVRFTDVEGNVLSYTVAETELLDGSDVEAMEAGDWDLTLFTCTVGGKTRVTVRCLRQP